MRTVSKGVTMRRSISCTNSLKFKKLVVFCYFVIYCGGLNYLHKESAIDFRPVPLLPQCIQALSKGVIIQTYIRVVSYPPFCAYLVPLQLTEAIMEMSCLVSMVLPIAFMTCVAREMYYLEPESIGNIHYP